jgi:carbonic anhydrase
MVRNWFALIMAGGAFACAAPEKTTPHAPTAAKSAHWTYAGATGPEHWGELSPAFALARSGKQQSPIDIVRATAVNDNLPPLRVDYHDTTLEILNNGHTIEDDYHGGGSLDVGGQSYRLAQFHFHSPTSSRSSP